MSFRGNVPAQDRGFYFDPSTANDLLSGQSIENPKQTIQAAIDTAAALIPPLSITATAQVTAAQGASVTASFVLEDFIQFEGAGILLSSDATVAIELASTLACEITGVFNDKLNGVCFKLADEISVSVRNGTMRVFGTDGVGFDVAGVCDDLFLAASQVVLAGERAIGFKVTASSPTPIDINSNTVVMDGNNTCFVDWGTPTINDIGTVDVSTVTAAGTGVEIFTARSGRLEVQAIALQAAQIVTVKNTAEFSLSAHRLTGDTLIETGGTANYKAIGKIVGDIVVETGATLDIICLEHIGTLTEDGTINGIINGVRFGNWAIGTTDTREFVMQSGRNGNVGSGTYLELAGLTMDGAAAGLILAYDCTLKAITIIRGDEDDATIRVQKNGATALDKFTSELAVVDANLNVAFLAGDIVAVQNSPTSANMMNDVGVTLWFERTI